MKPFQKLLRIQSSFAQFHHPTFPLHGCLQFERTVPVVIDNEHLWHGSSSQLAVAPAESLAKLSDALMRASGRGFGHALHDFRLFTCNVRAFRQGYGLRRTLLLIDA